MYNAEERKLSAIMFTDMVGYSALAQEDEKRALELLEEHQHILRPFFPKYGGREIETIGDAFFVEFTSALEAVKCAINIQKALWQRNETSPEKRHIKIRIGIHLGDVIHKGDNVLGDGVNIAARIEPLAQSCGICVSEDVARQVQNKIDYPLQKLEKKNLKNIQTPMDVYAVILDWLPVQSNSIFPKKQKKVFLNASLVLLTILFIVIGHIVANRSNSQNPDHLTQNEWENSIAVLPFEDFSQNKDQEYLCDGMTDQILTNLAKLGNLKVIARTSVMRYKNVDKTIQEIGKELNVENILEGSIQKHSNQLRVIVQLVKSVDGSHIWAETYDREYTDLFDIQDDISQAIADTLSEHLSPEQIDAIKSQRPVNKDAYEYYLKGEFLHRNDFWSSRSHNDFKASEMLLQKAIELDPHYAPSYSSLADLYNSYYNMRDLNENEKQHYMELQEKFISKAFELDSTSAEVNRVMGWIYMAKDENQTAFSFMKRAVLLDPNDPENVRTLGVFYDVLGMKFLASKCYARCIELDPFDGLYYYYYANVQFSIGDYEATKLNCEKALELDPNERSYLLLYVWLLYQMDEIKKADELRLKYLELFPNTDGAALLTAVHFAEQGQMEQALSQKMDDEDKILLYLYLQMGEQVIELSRNVYQDQIKVEQTHYLIMKYHPLNAFMQSIPAYQEIVQEHKLLYEKNLARYGDIPVFQPQ